MAIDSAVKNHKDLLQNDFVKVGSNRVFGVTVGGILAAVGASLLYQKGQTASYYGLLVAIGALLVLAGLVAPDSLSKLNRKWMQLGLLLGKITTPILMFIIFFTLISGLGLLMRICRSRPLDLSYDAMATSYWKKRSKVGFNPASMKWQF